MNRRICRVVLASGSVFAASTALSAHHSFAAAFDETKPVEVTGIMTAIRIENPHSWFYVDVTDQTGKVTYFEGTPIPTSVLLTAVLAWAAWQRRVGAQLPGGVWTFLGADLQN